MESIAGNNALYLTMIPSRKQSLSPHHTQLCSCLCKGAVLRQWERMVWCCHFPCTQPWLPNPAPSSGAAVLTQTPGKQSKTSWKPTTTKSRSPRSVPWIIKLQRRGQNSDGKTQSGRHRTALAPANSEQLNLLPNYISNMKLHKSI